MFYLLFDCNNFFASCEQLFNPRLRNQPIVVLSSNDGCIVARSKEAKALGIPMGAPYFEYKSFFLLHNVQVFSSNFELYGDISKRVIETVKTFDLPIEVYSIDEAFLFLSHWNPKSLLELGQQIKQKVFQWTGIHISVGIGPTKTLAKVANRIAKKEEQHQGVFAFASAKEANPYLKKLPVDEIWGIGQRLARRLYQIGIRDAFHFKEASDFLIKKQVTVTGLRTALELRGIPSFYLNEIPPQRKSILSSRSFGVEVTTLYELKQATATFVAKAAHKLRKEKLKAYFISVFIATNRFKETPYFSDSASLTLPLPSSHTPDLTQHAHKALEKIFLENRSYKRAGILLGELCSETEMQFDFFADDPLSEKKTSLMKTMDQINNKFSLSPLSFAAEGIVKNWKGLSTKCSPRYTTSWNELLKINL